MKNTTSFFDRILNPRKKKIIGLALSGGATYGAAHIGVLKVLEEAGIHPEIVTGTSAGALVGAAYCAGVPLQDIDELFKTMGWSSLIKISVRKHLSLFDTQPMEEFIKKQIGDIEFKDLRIPFSAVACNINTGERVILDKGPLAPAVRASAAIPGLFSPVEINGQLLVDGGIVDNLPVEQARAMGANYVIASDVSRREIYAENPSNPIEVFLSVIYIMQSRAALVDVEACDCYIRPLVSRYSSFSFKDSQKMMEAGMEAARRAVPVLQMDLKNRR